MLVDIHNVDQRCFVSWLGGFLQKIVDEKILDYDTVLRIVKYAVVDSERDVDTQYKENLLELSKECHNDIMSSLSEMFDKLFEDFKEDIKNDNKEN